jgi:hypothetical protein
MLPVNLYSYDQGVDTSFTGAVGLTVTRDGITELGRITHQTSTVETPPCPPDALCEPIPEQPICPPEADCLVEPYPYEYSPQIRRSLVVDDHVITVSDAGLESAALDTLAEQGFVPLAG